MTVINTKEPIILGFGDLVMLAASLLFTLTLRYNNGFSIGVIDQHVLPFGIIFAYSLVIFYISGLYGRMIAIDRGAVPGTIIRAQLASGLIAVMLFYFVPAFTVTPKITLFVYIGLSTALLILWRIGSYSLLSLRKKYPALVIGSGSEAEELIREMTVSPRIGLTCRRRLDPGASTAELIKSLEDNGNGNGGKNGSDFQYIIADLSDSRLTAILPELYKKYFAKTQILDLYDLYENIFERIPLTRMNYSWIMSNVSTVSPVIYDSLKRIIDIILCFVVGFVACIAYPFVACAIKFEDRGSVSIRQERVGRRGKLFKIIKYRSMQRNDHGKWVKESHAGDNKVTKVGKVIRKTRIDELPQALAILKGDMSLIGPRADIAGLSDRLEVEIPYYSVRTIIKPGLTGWAQVNQQKPPQSVEETRLRLSYDLYYIKHRSFGLDMKIILKTIKTLLSRAGM